MLGFLISNCRQQNTFSGWALQIGLLSGKKVSKQGLFDRLHREAAVFAKQILQQVLLRQAARDFTAGLFSGFGKVLLQDSTTLHLPQVLSDLFPGNYSLGEYKAVARIQSIIDIKAMKFVDLVLGAFTDNDQSASKSIVPQVKKGDLVIRDLGYFAIATFERLIKAEVHFLSRLKYGVGIYDKQGQPIVLKKLLQQRKCIDKWVIIGTERQIKVRLIMMPMPAHQVAERIRRARQNRDRRLNHSKEYYQWLGYTVYITTVHREVWNAKQVAKAYRVRWQIEIIFKSWKNSFHLQKMLHEGCGNENRVRVSIYLMLLFICLFMTKIYMRFKQEIEKKTNKRISLLKLSSFIVSNMTDIFVLPTHQVREFIARYCCYEERYDQINMTSLYQNLEN